MSETTLRDIIETAVDEHTPAPETVESTAVIGETEAETEAKAARARDAAGRFTKAEQDAKQAADEAKDEPERPRTSRPSSWKKEYWDRWDKVSESDPQFAQYLLEREQQFARGVSTYKAEADRAREFQQVLEPHSPRFQQLGVEPKEYIDRLLKMDELLASGTQQQRQAAVRAIAKAVGITDLSAAAEPEPQQGSIPPQLWNTVQNLQQGFEQMKRQQEAAEQAAYQRQIEEFAKNAPHMEELRDDMAQLLEAGIAADLPSAYEKALRLNDELYQRHLEEQRQKKDTGRQVEAKQAAQRARSAAVSPRSSTPTGSATASQQGGDLRSIISAAADAALGGGRI